MAEESAAPGATLADDRTALTAVFKHYVVISSVGATLTEPQKREIKDKGMNRMLKECCSDVGVAKASEAQVFPKFADRKTKKLSLEVFLRDFLPGLAAAVVQNRSKLSKCPPGTDPAVQEVHVEIRQQLAAKAQEVGRAKEVKVDAVTARLTDTRSYTGSHRERFDEAGRGKGIAGRKVVADASGYVPGSPLKGGDKK